MPAKVKLTYFGCKGRGEVIRLILAAAGVEYEDIRLQKSDWPSVRKNFPFGQLPMLEYDGVKMTQTNAICRYLAKTHGLAGDNPLDDYLIDTVVDQVNDLFEVVGVIIHCQVEDEKKLRGHAFLAEKLPKVLGGLEGLLSERGGNYFVGNKLSWADIVVTDRLTFLVDPSEPLLSKHVDELLGREDRVNALNKCPLLRALVQRVQREPNIQKWLESNSTKA